MSESNGHVTKQELQYELAQMEARMDTRLATTIDDAFTRFSQHILHEVGGRLDEVNKKLESIDARLKLQAV